MKNILPYIGRMNKIYLNEYVDSLKYDTYVEPFAGSFSCGFNFMETGFFGKCVLNDKDWQVYNFWTQVQKHPDELYDMIYRINNTLANRYNNKVCDVITELRSFAANDIELAAFEYLYRKNVYFINDGYKEYVPATINLDKDLLIDCSIRLMGVDILNLDYLDVLNKYDSSKTLFIMDPPYNVKNVTRYYRDVDNFNHEKLHNDVVKLQGDWIVRYNIEPYTAALYKDSEILFSTEKSIARCESYIEMYYSNIKDT